MPHSREDFGPNTWLVEELYRQYVTDPESVSDVWQEFFEDYQPRTGDGRPPATPAPPAPTSRLLAPVKRLNPRRGRAAKRRL
jgi:multifunctional 2-oxoglutarate metabolism enzyme